MSTLCFPGWPRVHLAARVHDVNASDAVLSIRAIMRAAPAAAECFTADTLVTMADGTKKRIADIKEGDYVFNLKSECYMFLI